MNAKYVALRQTQHEWPLLDEFELWEDREVRGRLKIFRVCQDKHTARIRLNNDVAERWLALKVRGHFLTDSQLAAHLLAITDEEDLQLLLE